MKSVNAIHVVSDPWPVKNVNVTGQNISRVCTNWLRFAICEKKLLITAKNVIKAIDGPLLWLYNKKGTLGPT